jgi:hypothetical protein
MNTIAQRSSVEQTTEPKSSGQTLGEPATKGGTVTIT